MPVFLPPASLIRSAIRQFSILRVDMQAIINHSSEQFAGVSCQKPGVKVPSSENGRSQMFEGCNELRRNPQGADAKSRQTQIKLKIPRGVFGRGNFAKQFIIQTHPFNLRSGSAIGQFSLR